MYKTVVKSLFDIVIASIATVLLFPFFVLTAIFIKFSSPGPVFFIQKRVGKNGREFNLFKFRTMYNRKRVAKEEVYKDNKEVTSIGYFLRRLKIDELPQILNILKGDMSLVGPRPFLPSQISHLDENGKIRLQVKPGLTGLAQINGNIYLDWKDRWKYDRKYVEEITFFLDIKIIFKTLAIIIVGEEKFLNKPGSNV